MSECAISCLHKYWEETFQGKNFIRFGPREGQLAKFEVSVLCEAINHWSVRYD